MVNVLLTSSGGELSPLIAKSLKKNKEIRVIGIDQKEQKINKFFFDKFYVVSKKKSIYLKQIKKIILKDKINLILPGSDEEALILSSNRKNLENKKLKIASSELNSIKTFSNKILTLKTLEKNNIKVGEWYVAHNKLELLKKLNFFLKRKKMVVIKPCFSRGGRNIFLISKKNIIQSQNPNGREITLSLSNFKKKYLKNFSDLFPIIIMEKLFEPTYDFDMLCKNGKLVNGICRRRLIPSMPNEGHIIENNKKIYSIGSKVAKIFNLSWLYDCDFMLNKKKEPILIEINPRMSGSAIVSAYAGYNLFENLISLFENKKIKKFKIRGKKIIVPYKELRNVKI